MNQTKNQDIQTKKPYNAPQLIEHGTIEEITGFGDPHYTTSGHTY
jgi:hypothetical protein